MPTTIGSLKRLVLTPDLREVTFARRGFPVRETDETRHLEAIPESVICGFEWGIDARDRWELERRLELVEPEQRGFAYEGATMATTIRDVMPGGGSTHTKDLLEHGGAKHLLLAYIGVGFAMSHLPRVLWKNVLPDVSNGAPYHPTMSWLCVDGYGFDLAYFHTDRWVGRQEVPAAYPWAGRPDYFPRAVDQGIGRALWFIHGGRPEAAAQAVGRFAPGRQADLWSGIGLASTFAGGATGEELARLVPVAGPHAPELALGSVFAAKARSFAGFVPQHTTDAVAALTGLPVAGAVTIADETAVAPDHDAPEPPYEVWRAEIRRRFAEAFATA